MRTLVCFRTEQGAYALPVESTVAVRLASGLVPLPGSFPDVAGVLPGQPPLTVLTTLGRGRHHVLVVRSHGRDYGLLVDEVTGLRLVSSDDVGPPPTGQDRRFFTGMLQRDSEVVLIADPVALAGQL